MATDSTLADLAHPKDSEAAKIIRYYSLCSAGAGVLSPPVLDLAAVTAIQLKLVRRLAGLYGKDFDQESGRSLVAALSGALAPSYAGQAGARLLLRWLGPGILGGLAAGTAIPTLNYGATSLVGKLFQGHFKKAGNEKVNFSDLGQAVAAAVVR